MARVFFVAYFLDSDKYTSLICIVISSIYFFYSYERDDVKCTGEMAADTALQDNPSSLILLEKSSQVIPPSVFFPHSNYPEGIYEVGR